MFDTGDDSMQVTSQVVGGFVVIDANASDEKKVGVIPFPASFFI